MRPSAVLAVDVGGTSLKGAVVDAAGRVVTRHSVPTPADPDGSVTAIVDLATTLHEAAIGAELQPAGVGIVVPGQVDEQEGVAVFAANLGWRDVPLRRLVQQRLDLPVAVGHDVTAGGRAELAFGGHQHDDAVVVQIGTGIAATLVSGGRVLRGATGLAGEFGHIPVVPDGEPCPCGQRGCLERYCSAAAVVRRYRAAGGPDLTAAQLTEGLDDDPLAATVWSDAVDALALGITTLTMLLDPQVVVVSGGLSAAGEALLAPLREATRRRTVWRPVPRLTVSALGAEVGLAGAALVAWEGAGRGDEARWAP